MVVGSVRSKAFQMCLFSYLGFDFLSNGPRMYI